jgi:flagellar biosynthesis/type III secretory pathway M-ring protein FliF/YscJ
MAKIGGGVLIALIFLIVVFRIYRMTLAPVNAMLVDADAPNGPYPMVLAERAIEQYQSLNAAERHDEAAIEEAQLAQMDPQRVALVIRNMIAEDRA